jgi:hypothetical protein
MLFISSGAPRSMRVGIVFANCALIASVGIDLLNIVGEDIPNLSIETIISIKVFAISWASLDVLRIVSGAGWIEEEIHGDNNGHKRDN